jgi:sulfofructose kinase
LTSASAGVGARIILCAGIIALDEVFRVDRFPQPDAKTQAQSFFVVNGGCAGNAAVAIARLGGRAVLAGPLGGPPGEDSNGDRVLAALAREQVDCSGCQRIAGAPTALSAIFLDAHGDRMIVTYGDDRLAVATPCNPAHLVASADVVLADNRFPEFVRPICAAARARGLTVVLDADRPTQMSDDLFRIATHVVFSSECLRATTGLDDLVAALAAIARTTPSFLAVTHGPHDVLWLEGASLHKTPGVPGQGHRYARRGRRLPRRVCAGARGGPRRCRGAALCRGGRRPQMHAAWRQHGGALSRRGRGLARRRNRGADLSCRRIVS